MAGSHHVEYGYDEILKTVEWLRAKTQHRPKIGIICGSGLGGLVSMAEECDIFPYSDVPLFPVSTVSGHKGNLVFGKLGGKECIFMQGRFHPYEGYPFMKCAMPVRVMKLLGIHTLIVTNAAGGLHPEFNVGDIMVIKDHINLPGFSGNNPLNGPNDDRFGPRFPGMNRAYDSTLRKRGLEVAEKLGYQDFFREGVYVMLGGPSYEAPAEARFLRTVGGDAVGMSTAHEVIVAVHCGLRVFGMSLITNKVAMDYRDDFLTNHAEVLETSQRRADAMQKFVTEVISCMDDPSDAPAAATASH